MTMAGGGGWTAVQMPSVPNGLRATCRNHGGSEAAVQVPPAGVLLTTATHREAFSSQECDPEKQESDIRKTIQQWEAELGPDHPSITSLVGSLASLLEGQGRWQEAEQVHRRTLAKELQLVGRNHPNTAKALQSIARCMMARSAYAEAEGLLEEAMKIQELHTDKPDGLIVSCLETMAAIKSHTGDYKAAVLLLKRAVAALGYRACGGLQAAPEMPKLLLKLASAQGNADMLPEAENSLQRAINQLRERPESSKGDLALALSQQGTLAAASQKYTLAEESMRECLRLQEELLGDRHPVVAEATRNLAQVLAMAKNGKEDEAEMLYQRAIDIQEGITGLQTHRIAATFKVYADLLVENPARYEDAEILYRHCATLVMRQQDDVNHSEAASVFNRLAVLLVKLGRLQEAEQQLQKAISFRLSSHGKESLKVAQDYESLGNLLMQLPGRTLEGIEMYEKGLSVRERLFEKRELRGRELAEPMSNLGTLLKRFDRYRDGEELCRRADEIRRTDIDPEMQLLEEYLRTGDLMSPRTHASFKDDSGRASKGSPSDSGAFLPPSPRVDNKSIMPAKQLKGVDADALRMSREFKQWARNSAQLDELLEAAKQQNSKGPTQDEMRDGSSAARSAMKRYDSLDLDEIEEDVMRQPGFSTADHDDELVLMDTINGGTSLGCDDTWDFGVSNTIPVKMMINHAAKQSEQTEFQRQWRPRGGTGGSDEELDLDDLLQNFMESDSFRADNLQESLDDVDNILKTVRVQRRMANNDSSSGAGHSRRGNTSTNKSLDEMIMSLKLEDFND